VRTFIQRQAIPLAPMVPCLPLAANRRPPWLFVPLYLLTGYVLVAGFVLTLVVRGVDLVLAASVAMGIVLALVELIGRVSGQPTTWASSFWLDSLLRPRTP
jgi:hypothetical protein